MKISETTLAILKNFAKFNEGILIKPGNELTTKTAQNNVFAKARIAEDFGREVPLYNLNQFIAALGLFKDPDLDFQDTKVEISEGTGADKRSILYFYADKSVIVYPEKDVRLPPADLEFSVTADVLDKLLSAARTLSLPNITLLNKAGRKVLRAHDAANPSSNKYDVDVGVEDKYTDDNPYAINFKIDNLKLLDLDYNVKIVFRGIAEFSNQPAGISYAIGLAQSTTPQAA